ncbi:MULTISPECIES: hypothetical protein [Burkholderia]|uniref:hypothetical protein n=1 Tax=Burkholderia TaxID=32008 RepID=UPI001641B3C4|nr:MULTISPECIES: hypothetical protein [Burkholderia]MBJ9920613.1 hypothetical protein [Burkholderia cenocepacia]UVS90874.1 hypothetical protein EFP17_14505 [Burkholderia glumae]
MSLLVLSHLIQLAALSSLGVLNVILAAYLGLCVGLVDGAAHGLMMFRDQASAFFTFVQHPWVVGRVAWVAAVLVAMVGVRQHLKRAAR